MINRFKRGFIFNSPGAVLMVILMSFLLMVVFVGAQEKTLETDVYVSGSDYFLDSRSEFMFDWNKVHLVHTDNNLSINLVSKDVGFCMDFLFSSNLDYERIEGDFCNRVYYFKPKDTIVFSYNFTILYFALLLLVLYAGYRYYESKTITLTKNIKPLMKAFHGMRKLRVEYILDNKTSKTYRAAVLTDLIPNVLDIEPSEFGSVKPEIEKTISGQIVKYDFGIIGPGERFIVYFDVSSKLDLSEDFSLDESYFEYDGLFKRRKIKINH